MNDWHTDLAFAAVLLAEIIARRCAPSFAAVLAIRLCFELLGRFSENSYLDLQAAPAAASAALLCVVGTWLARKIVRDGDNVAMAASTIAVALATFAGVQDLAARQQATAPRISPGFLVGGK